MKSFPKIELPSISIDSEGPTPVQFLPSAMLSWRAPIMMRSKPLDRQPEPPQKACGATV